MTKDVIELAREAGLIRKDRNPREASMAQIDNFAALVAARERERVANLVLTTDTWRNAGWVSTICPITTQAIATAIRALKRPTWCEKCEARASETTHPVKGEGNDRP